MYGQGPFRAENKINTHTKNSKHNLLNVVECLFSMLALYGSSHLHRYFIKDSGRRTNDRMCSDYNFYDDICSDEIAMKKQSNNQTLAHLQ